MVMEMFAKNMGVKVIRANAQDKFLDGLVGVSDPEKKRKVIGNTFIEIFDEESHKIENVKFLAQGTIYPDVIESAASKTGKAHVIKSHHNVGGLPDHMALKLVEPLRELFKDEVRKIGVELGLPYDMVYRHPFPGPGLGVRILGEVKAEYCAISSVKPMRSLSKSYTTSAGTKKPAKPLPYSCRLNPSVLLAMLAAMNGSLHFALSRLLIS